ncbi:MAG TPA: PIG-L family deacetylase [Bryobacteraceae bacterium]|nr:PIG-L family deacetylase [Bryobacteraceae bacterium]
MTRRFCVASLAAAAIPIGGRAQSGVVVERDLPGKPHSGKMLAAIQPHADDIPIFAAGVVAKLIREGYTGYLIRTTIDDAAGPGTGAESVIANYHDNLEVARALGLRKAYDLNYRNHQMDGVERLEYRSRLIFLIRLLKIDTVICYDPWGSYEENPDHYFTAQGVEAACWMAGGNKDYPEHFDAGLKPHAVTTKYYHARGPQLVNRIVDISSVIDTKVAANLANKAQGPAGETGARLRARLAAEGKRLPMLGEDDATANREYIKQIVLKGDRELGAKYGVQYAEAYHYIGPPTAGAELEEMIRKNAVSK